MASFTGNLNPVVENGYVNASQGTPPNRALGTLFSGIAGGLKQYQDDQKKAQGDALTADAEAAISGLNNDVLQGPADTIFSQPKPNSPLDTPAELSRAGDRLSRLKQAYQSGKTGDMYYQTQVAKISKDLRAKYPEFEDKIDDMLSNITGTSPANQVRKLLDATFEKELSSQSAEEKDRRAFLERNKELLADDGVREEYARLTGSPFNPENFDRNAALIVVGRHEKKKADLELEKNQVALEKSKLELGQAKEEDVARKGYKAAVQEATYLRDRLLAGAFASNEPMAGTSVKLKDLQKFISTAAADGVSPEERTQIMQQLAFVKMSMAQAADQLLNGVDKNGFSYNQYVKSESDKAEVRNILMGPVALIEDAILNKDYGVINQIALDNKARQEAADNSILKKDGGLIPQMEALRKASPEMAKAVSDALVRIQTNSSDLTDGDKALAARVSLYLAQGVPLTKLLTEVSLDPNASGKGAMAGIKAFSESLANPAVPKEKLTETVEKIFGAGQRDLLEQFGQERPEVLFNTLVNPEIIQNISKTPAFQTYSKWAMSQAKDMMKPYAAEMIKEGERNHSINIQYDEKTGRFVSSLGPGMIDNVTPYGIFEKYGVVKGYNSVSKMNEYLNTIQPILDANGIKTDEYLNQFFGSEDYKNIVKKGNVFEQMGKTFGDYIRSNVEMKYNPDSSKEDKKRQDEMMKILDQQGSADMKGKSIIAYRNSQATRNQKVTPELQSKLDKAVSSVFGDGYTVEIFSGGQPGKGSGKPRTGSIRHDHGRAADVYIVGPDGKRVTDKKQLDKLKDYWLANDFGSVGTYMRGMGLHLDEWTKEELLAGMSSTWNY